MRVTKFVHSCLLVELPEPTNRTALFDPGCFSSLDPEQLQYLDDIFITHDHPDHMDIGLIQKLCAKFPNVRITAPADAKTQLDQAGIHNVNTDAPEGVRFFTAPHEDARPFGTTPPPEEIGIHYMNVLSDPGDSHHFSETMPVLALPITAPWGSVVGAVQVALAVRPKYIIPIHDWHWRPEALRDMYDRLEARFKQEGITFMKPVDGEPMHFQLEDITAAQA